jgi:hypothetical protein
MPASAAARAWPRLLKEKLDGFVKNPSAALRFNFVVAAYLFVRFTPQFLRALHLELFTKPSFPLCEFHEIIDLKGGFS